MALKNAIVTGGAGDIGMAIARKLAAGGWRVGLLDLAKERVDKAAASAPNAVPLVADVTDEASCAAAVARFGDVDLLVNNAGIGRFGKLHELAAADFRAVIEVNLVAPFLMAKAVAGGMIARRRGGVIVNITSIGGINPAPGAGSYGAAKAGLARLTELMALEWGPFGIRANSIAPGFIDGGISAQFYADPRVRALRSAAPPLKRLGTPEDVANAVAFLASDEAAYISGQELAVDGGVTPSVLMQLPREL